MSCLGYKDGSVLRNAFKVAWHERLLDVFDWINVRYSKITLTSTYRDKLIHVSDSGIHMTSPLRAFDLRSKDFSNPWTVRDDINQGWMYDPKRPWLNVCVYHNTGLGWHFHCQVHDNTKRR